MKGKHPLPPRIARRFLHWYCRPEIAEDLEGDLNELFDRNCKQKSPFRARLIYIIDVIKFLRPYTIRQPEISTLLISWIMIGSYIKTSTRSIVRNRLFSAINIIGLAISMSVGLLLISMLTDLKSYDRFHTKSDRIYRVINDYSFAGNQPRPIASTSVAIGQKIQESVTGIDDVVLMRREFAGDATFDDKIIPLKGLYANNRFFNVFSFPLISGNPETALREPFSIVLTETSAKKLFGNTTDATGKILKFTNADSLTFTVTGVMKDIPHFSHMQFEMLVSFKTAEEILKNDTEFYKWENIWQNYVYVLLPENGKEADVQARLDELSKEENAHLEHKLINLKLQPLKSIALGPEMSNNIGPSMPSTMIYILSGLVFIVILSACFNYTNLSLARSLRRSKEVGIRKVVGAFKSHIRLQFLVESVLIAFLSLSIAFVIFLYLRPHFIGLAPDFLNIVQLNVSPKLIFLFVAFAAVVGLMAGILPAVFFTKLNAIQVLKSSSSVKVFRNISLRKITIVVQYTFSLMFIAGTIIGYKQHKFLLTKDLGYQTENVYNIELQGNKPELLEKEFREIKGVAQISRSSMITSIGNYWGTTAKYKGSPDSTTLWYNQVDENYIPLHAHKLLAGRNFNPKAEAAEESEAIVNEELLKYFNIADRIPEKAVGEEIIVDRKKLTIIGVVKNFNYGKLDSKIDPVMFRYAKAPSGYLNLKITSADIPATLASLQSAWSKIDKVHPFHGKFYDEQLEEAYNDFSSMLQIVGFLSFLAITISSIGLLGMVVFTTETRLKEISIRKVLGASEYRLVILLSRNFIILLSIAAAIALPLTYLMFDKVLLSDFAYRETISIAEMLLSVVAVLGIALALISSQTIRVARSNPVEVLKAE